MDRSRFVLKYITETDRIICKTCIGMSKEELGRHVSCFYGSCAVRFDDFSQLYIGIEETNYPIFDNTKHRIITTLDFCRGKEFGCNNDCNTNCMVPIVQEKFRK